MDLKNIKKVSKIYLKELISSFAKIDKLKKLKFFSGIHFKDAVGQFNKKIEKFNRATRESNRVWKKVELSRSDERPQCRDYIKGIFTDFMEFSGDRLSGDDSSIIAGLGKIGGRTVAVVGHDKGKNTNERIKHNFGMSTGAHAGLEAEDNGQSAAISGSIRQMFELNVPVIAVLIGEGGSGGALALAIGDEVAMLENSTYSVISPEACSAILWKDATGKKLAARALKITSKDLLRLKVIEKVIHEPMGGGQKEPERMIKIVKKYINDAIGRLGKYPPEQLRLKRAEKFESIGFFTYG